jgi:hypothetical protein
VYTLTTSIVTPSTGIVNSTQTSHTPPFETSFGGFSNLVSFSAVAAPGVLEAESSANTGFLGPNLGYSESGTAIAKAEMELDNVVFSGPTTNFMYSVNFTISGSITLTTVGFPDVSGGVNLFYDGGIIGGLGVTTDINDQTPPTGIFAGITDPSSITVSAMTPEAPGTTAPGGVSVGFGLLTSAHADSGPGSMGDLIVNFGDPFSLPSSGPVFNFFDLNGSPLTGMTANSSDGCIVNDVFMCGSVIAPGAVPEFSTWAMMLVGFAGLGSAGWRRGWRQPAVPTGEEIGL